jgi:ubiquitin carboxyl-terminal hydrolase 5/13
MFKSLISKDSRDFSSSKQQDASEYFQYLLKQIQKYERVGLRTRFNLSPVGSATNAAAAAAAASATGTGSGTEGILKDTPSVFEYEIEERYQCQVTNQVKYITGKQTLTNILELPIPLEDAINQVEVDQLQEKKRKLQEENPEEISQKFLEDDVKLIVPFQSCLDFYFRPTLIELRNPSLSVEGLTPALKTQRFQYFPKYLMVKLGRYYVDANWIMRKIDAEVPVPEFLDLSSWKVCRGGGLQDDEVAMPESSPTAPATCGEGNTTTLDANEDIVNQLTAMGFSMNGSKRAAIATQNISVEVAMNWVFEHMEDADFNDPPSPPMRIPAENNSSSMAGGFVAEDEDAVVLLTALGYSETQCRAALRATDNNPERCHPLLLPC